MTQAILEARGVIVESAEGGLAVQYITPGIGSSGYYAPDVLSEAAGAGLFPKGMHLYIDHPSATDRSDRPERSVRDIGGISTSDGVWNEEAQAVEAQIKILEGHSWLSDPDLRSAIGLSIRAAGDVTEGTVQGRKMPVVEKLTEVFSVDFVTHAGRGGRILEAKVENAMLEASANDRRETLNDAVRVAYGANNTYLYVEDYDDEAGLVYFNLSSPEADQTYSQTYDATDTGVSLTGARVEVRRVTNYVPVRAGTNETTEGENVTAPAPELVEAQSALAEARSTIAERDAEIARLREAESLRNVRDAARTLATAHLSESKTAPAMLDRIVGAVSVDPKRTEAGALDESALKAEADRLKAAEVAYLAQFQSSPSMTGGGFTQAAVQESGVTREQSDATRAAAFGRK